MWRILRRHITTMAICFAVGAGTATVPAKEAPGLWVVPLFVAGAMSLGQVLSADLDPFRTVRLFAEKVALAYLAFGIGFAALRALS